MEILNKKFYINGIEKQEYEFCSLLKETIRENYLTCEDVDESTEAEFIEAWVELETHNTLIKNDVKFEYYKDIKFNTIERLDNLIEDLLKTTSRNEKENILSKYKNDNEVKELLNFIYNPYIITGISKKKINKFKYHFDEIYDKFDDSYKNIFNLLNYLKLHNHGRDEDLIEIEKYIVNSDYDELIYSIVSKDLKLGIQATTLNKIYGKNFIPQFGCMLAQKYFDNPDKLIPDGTEFLITPKLDGVRCLLINNSVTGLQLFSRQGQPLDNFNQLIQEAHNLPTGYVYDGELLLNNKNLESKDLYRETMKIVSSDAEKENIIFNVFDILPVEDFMNGYSKIKCVDRKNKLKDIFASQYFKYITDVPILYQGTDKSKINLYLDSITKNGGEGIMLNVVDSPYECKRSKGLLKVKKMQTADVKVIGIEEGTGKNIGKVGALKIEFIGPDGKLYLNDVGSGLTDEDRVYFWDNPDKIINKIIEIKYFEISNNQNGTYGLRFPVFKWVRDDKNEISMY